MPFHINSIGLGSGEYGERNTSFMLYKDAISFTMVELRKFATESNLNITVCHFPPGMSKWNGIEHRMFSYIKMNWRGKPLRSFQAIIELIVAEVNPVMDKFTWNGTIPCYPEIVNLTVLFINKSLVNLQQC